ncbi:unnamed protein product [Durusdinium trenchii]|uniref:Uncharacterized protein n=1 Tax=Durusdinium trenchii TaxID=1381693 RepID=A0ABP0LIE7_9DINO
MGNAAPSVSRVLELRLARPTWHQGDLSRHLELRPWPAPLFSAPAPPLRPRWEETFRMEVEMGLEVRVMQGEQELARGVLEAIPPVPQLVFRVVPLPLAPSSFGTLEVKLREAPSEQGEEGRFQFQMPLARRQVISLELQNAELLKRLKGRASRDGRRTELTERERAPMRHQQLLAEAYAQTAELLQKKQHLRRRLAAMKLLCHSELPRLRGQLQQALARQQQLKADAEAKIASLQERLRHAQEKGLSEVEVQGLVALALGRREELQRKLREEAEAQASQESPEVAHLQELSLQQQEELDRRREQLARIAQGTQYQAWKRHDAAVASVAQLFQRLEELSRSMQDDQVCSESELLELRQERNALKDRLEDAVSSLRQLSARAALLQPAAADAGPAGPAEPTAGAGAAEPSELQRRVWQAEGELQELKRMENLRLQRIQTLELHQESLVEQTTWATATSSVSGEDARRTLQSLEQSVAELQASVVAKKDLLEETRERSQKGQRYIQALQQQQLQLISQADERVLRNPRPPRSATAVRFYETRRGFRQMADRLALPEAKPKPAVLSNERNAEIYMARSEPGSRDGWMRHPITGKVELWEDHWQTPKCIQQYYQPGTIQLRCPGEPPRWMYADGDF